MRVRSHTWTADSGWSAPLGAHEASANLVLSFGPLDAPGAEWFASINAHSPAARHVYVSGGGQIAGGMVDDDVTVVSFLTFEGTTVHPIVLDHATVENSAALGAELGASLREIPGVRHVLLFAEGITFIADSFLNALNPFLPSDVKVSGGLASNGTALTHSAVGLDAPPVAGRIVALALTGESLVIGTGSVGGWDFFGPERIVTRATTAVVHELDGERALDVYKRYLGEFASELPGSALLFPLAVRVTRDSPVGVRTIIAVDEESGSMRFAGDIPQGSIVRLMRTTTDKLADGAARAARMAREDVSETLGESFTLCISCIGRRAVMRSRVEEEIDEVQRESGSAVVVGFYSNGEIAPPTDGRDFGEAVLHNQTMTVTTIAER
ncbi:FIST C-terminal domain-containing protein [Gemmatimonas sp.]|uniref:FIST signal transduction protein n=1 Tax=Gemmatimonas sp. TaxID=1962908 RepID=UPI003342BBFA